MKFTPGDKVSFINEKQNGTVVRCFPDGRVLVEIEDGFEFEVLEKELVKTGNVISKEIKAEAKVEQQIPEQTSSSLSDLCEEGSVCLAGVPASTGAVLTGTVNYFLINKTEFDLVYTWFMKKKNSLQGVSRGVLEKQKEVMLGSFRRDDLVDISSFVTEAMFYYENKRPALTHIRKENDILLPTISQTNKGASGITAFAKVVEIYSGKEPEPDQIKDLITKLSSSKNSSYTTPKETSKSINPEKYGILINEKVVDLHIEELYPDFSELSNAEMIAIQMRHFANEMNHAIKNHFKRMIFIHGVGNGVLKNEIRSELKKYDGITFKDGDYSKYGSGATEINW